MYPLLFKLGVFKIHTYGLLIVMGFLFGLYLVQKDGRKVGLNPDRIIDVSFWGLGAGLLGGRIVYIITRWEYFSQNLLEVFYFWEGGLVFYGGFLGGLAAFYFYTRRHKMPFLKTVDVAVPSLAIAHFFGRLGCFFAGCCFGRPALGSVPWAVTFTNPVSLAPLGTPLHPTQLYDALNALVIFTVLQFTKNRKKFIGQQLCIYMILYAIGRSIVEVYRGDSIRGFVIDPYLSTSQFISIFIFVSGLALWMFWSKRNKIG
jgi:phosphatidylglycerol:prolipoprotein diacylglycerol transferase